MLLVEAKFESVYVLCLVLPQLVEFGSSFCADRRIVFIYLSTCI